MLGFKEVPARTNLLGRESRSLQKSVALLLVAFTFLSMQPVFVWGKDWLFAIVGGLFFAAALPLLKFKKWSWRELAALYVVLIFFGFLCLPIREYDSFSMRHLAYMVGLVAMLFANSGVLRSALARLRNLFCLIVVLSLFSILFFLIGAPFPDVVVSQEVRAQSTDTYRLYYGMIYLNTQLYDLGVGLLIRNIGWFGEPGHFGIYLCLLLLNERSPLSGKTNKILIAGIISTFSAAAYLILLLLLLIKERMFKSLLSMLFFSVLLFVFDDQFNVVLNKLALGGGVLASREVLDTEAFLFDPFSFFWGYGEGVLDVYGFTSSNLLAFFYRYGLLGVSVFSIIVLISVHSLALRGSKRDAAALLAVMIIISLHRSWMIDTMYLWFVLLYSVVLGRTNSVSRGQA